MAMDIDAREYFLTKQSDSELMRKTYSRIAKALYFHGDLTMNQLCAMPEKELKMIRGIGDKTRAVIMAECQYYLKKLSQTEDSS